MNLSLLADIERRRDEADQQAAIAVGVGLGNSAYGAHGSQDASAILLASGIRYKDKAASGLLGLRNQGATCYLNSFIQTLFMTPSFRRAIFEWRFMGDRSNARETDFSIAFQLQSLFARLQCSEERAVATGALTKSFGWTQEDVWRQQDVQELFHVMWEHLQASAAGTPLGERLTPMMQGIMFNYTICNTCGYKSLRPDPFIDIPLQVDGCDDVHASFAEFTKAEVMDGDNKYLCGACASKQPARRGTQFTKFPELLALQLRRFNMNWMTMMRIKLTSRLVFPQVLDVAPYLNTELLAGEADAPIYTQPDGDSLKYELYSVLIHSGSAAGGHYFTYTKNVADGTWHRMDDSDVSQLSPEEVDAMFNPVDESENKPADNKDTPAELRAQEERQAEAKKAKGPSMTANVARELENSLQMHQRLGNTTHGKTFVDPTTNAYMLMYRRIDAHRAEELESGNSPASPEDVVSADLLPEVLRQEIAEENSAFLVQKAEYARLQSLVRLRVIRSQPDGSLADPVRVEVPKTTTVRDAAAVVHEALKLADEGVAPEQVRLRRFELPRQLPWAPFSDEEQDKALQDIPFKDFDHVYLEVRDADAADFPAWLPPNIRLSVVELDRETNEYRAPQELDIGETAMTGELRMAVCSVVRQRHGDDPSIVPSRIRMAISRRDNAQMLLEDEVPMMEDGYAVEKNDTIYAELCDEGQTFKEGESAIQVKFMDELSKITVVFNDIDMEEEEVVVAAAPPAAAPPAAAPPAAAPPAAAPRAAATPPAAAPPAAAPPAAPPAAAPPAAAPPAAAPPAAAPPAAAPPAAAPPAAAPPTAAPPLAFPFKPKPRYKTHSVTVDGRLKLADLKQAIAEYCDVDPSAFRIKESQNGGELKDLDASLASFRIHDKTNVWIERGAPMSAGQRLFRVYKAVDGVKPSTASDEGSFAPLGEVTLNQSMTNEEVKRELAAAFPDAGFEVSHMRVRNKVGRLAPFLDSALLRKNVPGKKDGREIYVEKTDEPDFLDDNSLLIFVQQWFPAEQRLGEAKEIAASKTDLVTELNQRVADLSGIAVDDLRCTRVRLYQLRDPASVVPTLDWFGKALRPESQLGGPPWSLKSGDYVLYKDNSEAEQRPEAPTIKHVKPTDSSNAPAEIGIVFRSAEELAALQDQQREERERREAEAEARRQEMAELAKERGLAAKAAQTPEELEEQARRAAELEQARLDAIERLQSTIAPDSRS